MVWAVELEVTNDKYVSCVEGHFNEHQHLDTRTIHPWSMIEVMRAGWSYLIDRPASLMRGIH